VESIPRREGGDDANKDSGIRGGPCKEGQSKEGVSGILGGVLSGK
jgi:hypothetical protein